MVDKHTTTHIARNNIVCEPHVIDLGDLHTDVVTTQEGTLLDNIGHISVGIV